MMTRVQHRMHGPCEHPQPLTVPCSLHDIQRAPNFAVQSAGTALHGIRVEQATLRSSSRPNALYNTRAHG